MTRLSWHCTTVPPPETEESQEYLTKNTTKSKRRPGSSRFVMAWLLSLSLYLKEERELQFEEINNDLLIVLIVMIGEIFLVFPHI